MIEERKLKMKMMKDANEDRKREVREFSNICFGGDGEGSREKRVKFW